MRVLERRLHVWVRKDLLRLLDALDQGLLTPAEFHAAKAALAPVGAAPEVLPVEPARSALAPAGAAPVTLVEVPEAAEPPAPEAPPLKRRRPSQPCLLYKAGVCLDSQCPLVHRWCWYDRACTLRNCGFRHSWDV